LTSTRICSRVAHFLRLRVQFGAPAQFRGASKIGDELADGDALGGAIVNEGIIHCARGNAGVVRVRRADGGRAAVNVGEKGGLNLLGPLSGGQGGEVGHGNPGMLRQGDLPGLLQRQMARGFGGASETN
jgi:hypothetical protein